MNDFNDNKLSAIVGIGGVLLSMIILIISAKTYNTALTVVGVIIFVLTIVVGSIMGKVTNASEKSKYMRGLSDGSVKTTSKYHLLLIDERTKQDPDVQRLLQYPTVQKAFFDPNYITSAAAQNDPYILELLEVLDRMSDNGAVNGDFVQYPNAGGFADPNSAFVSEMNKHGIDRREREKKRPRRTVGRIITAVGLIMFCLPFFSALTGAFGKNFTFIFGAAPFGMVLIVIGKIIGK